MLFSCQDPQTAYAACFPLHMCLACPAAEKTEAGGNGANRKQVEPEAVGALDVFFFLEI